MKALFNITLPHFRQKSLSRWGLFIFFYVIFLIHVSINTSYGAQYWAKTYDVNKYEKVYSMQQTADGGYVLTGYVKFNLDYDIWVLKLDADGEFSWGKSYGGEDIDTAHSIKQTNDGGYIVAGRTKSFGSGDNDFWILKLDQNGDVVWQKTYGGSNGDSVNSIQQTIDGGFIVVGYTESFGAGNSDVLVLKIDSSGDVSWQMTYGGSGYETAHSVQETSDGKYIVAGSSDEAVLVLKLEVNGDITWQKIYSDQSYVFHWASSIQQTTDGGYIVACNYEESGLDIYPLILKLDSTGDISWQKIKWHSTGRYTYSITQTTDGGYIMVGETVTTHWGNLWILKLDSSGNGSWKKSLGNAGSGAHSVLQTPDGGYVIAGIYYTIGIVGGSHNALVLKLDSTGTIPDCDLYDANPSFSTFFASVQDSTSIVQPSSVTVAETSISPQNTSAPTNTICSSDIDEDGIPNNDDNCPLHPNSPMLGICTWYQTGHTCLSDEECGTGGFCSMDQADNINCDCKSNFDCDFDVDGTDAARFKADFGRSPFDNPCDYYHPCHGDFECDGDVDGTDASEFKEYFGTIPLPPYSYCLSCVDGVYQYDCSYQISSVPTFF